MKIYLLILLVCLSFSSCSNKSGSPSLSSTDGMTVNQIKARDVITEDIKYLNDKQYGISDDEVAMLKSEGLLSQEELNSLKIVR